jgi:amidase
VIGRTLFAAYYAAAVDSIRRAARQVAEFFTRYDILLTATTARPPVTLGELSPTRSELLQMGVLRVLPLRPLLLNALDEAAHGPLAANPNTQLFNMTGQPAISLPLSWNAAGLPIGTPVVALHALRQGSLQIGWQ